MGAILSRLTTDGAPGAAHAALPKVLRTALLSRALDQKSGDARNGRVSNLKLPNSEIWTWTRNDAKVIVFVLVMMIEV